MNLSSGQKASTPILIEIQEIQSTISKLRYVTLYEVPTSNGCYRPLDTASEMMLTNQVLRFKILDLEAPDSIPIYRQGILIPAREKQHQTQISHSQNSCLRGKIKITMSSPEGQIVITAKIINKSTGESTIYALSVSDMSGYQDFIDFRRKYKTLENVTRKQDFQLDYRLKIVDSCALQPFYFSLQQSDRSKYYFSVRALVVELEEIFKVEEWQSIETIYTQQLDLMNLQQSGLAQWQIIKKLKLTLNIEMIHNCNFTKYSIANLRVFEVDPILEEGISISVDGLGITNIKPLLQGKYYDYQYGYMQKNIKSLADTSAYDHLEKLTPSFPHYPHFINSIILDVHDSRFLVFKIGDQQFKLPFVYVLKGLNIVHCGDFTIKFYVELQMEANAIKAEQEQAGDIRRFFQLQIKDLWNLGKIAQKYRQFSIKIVTENIIYTIPFHSTEVEPNNFRKQSKQLSTKQQYGQFHENKYYILTKSNTKQKLLLTKTEVLNNFYLLDMVSSSPICFQVVSSGKILVQSVITRTQAAATRNLEVLMSSHDNLLKVVLSCNLLEIQQKSESLRSCYKILHRLEFTDDIPCDGVQYSLEILREGTNKRFKAKISPQIQSDGVSSLTSIGDGFYNSGSSQLDLLVSLRKRFYDEQTEQFDSSEILHKKIVVNALSDRMLDKDRVMISLVGERYTGIDYDFYDENIKKRLKLHLEIVLRKNTIFDVSRGVYRVKVPQLLWKFNSAVGECPTVTFESHLTKRKKRGGKVSVFPDSPQEYQLPFNNYKDGISISLGDGRIGYEKVMDAVRLKCDIVNNSISWMQESQWYLSIINIGEFAFHFLLKCCYEPGLSDDGSVKSGRTASKHGSQRSFGDKVDPFAKTVKNKELFNLKKLRNDAIAESRQLTAKYVRCQESIAAYTKKIHQLSEQRRKRAIQEKQIISRPSAHEAGSNQNKKSKMKLFYRSICACGERNPKYNGYCEQCLDKIRKRYEVYLKEYTDKACQYERMCFDKFNSKQKLIRSKNKLQHYKERLRLGEDIEEGGMNDVLTQFEERAAKRQIEEDKIVVFQLKQDRESIESAGRTRLEAIEQMIRKEDEGILQGTQQLQLLRHQLADLYEQIDNNKDI